MKQCTGCRESKPVEAFSAARGNADGLQRRCKACNAAYHRANRERISQRGAEYRKNNPHLAKEYRERNAERIKEYGARYRAENAARRREYQNQPEVRERRQRLAYLRKHGVEPPGVGTCEICATTGPLVIDHDHACCPAEHSCEKCRRGLLCNECNRALGYLYDSVEVLQAAVSYLDSYRKRQSPADRLKEKK